MLSMAISATVASRLSKEKPLNATLDLQQEVQAPNYDAATPPTNEDQRQSTIERLRALIAQGDVIESSPSVEAAPVPESESVSVGDCAPAGTGIEIARQWPLENVSISTVGAQRVVSHVEPIAATASASGTSLANGMNTVLLQLPISPSKQTEPVCLDSEIVGVTLDGSLIFNADVILYRATGAETLIGYARDGFPIYGNYGGEVDQCGGYDGPGGYRYSVSGAGNAFVSCFVGQPQSFSL